MPRWKELKGYQADEDFKRIWRNPPAYVEGDFKETVTGFTRIF